jgi:hypothetical protein
MESRLLLLAFVRLRSGLSLSVCHAMISLEVMTNEKAERQSAFELLPALAAPCAHGHTDDRSVFDRRRSRVRDLLWRVLGGLLLPELFHMHGLFGVRENQMQPLVQYRCVV